MALFIDFPNVHQVLSDHSEKYVFHNGIGHASTKILTAEQRMSWLDFLLNTAVVSEDVGEFLLNESVHCTTFVGVSGNHIHLIHSEPTQFLCIKLDGSILHLPGLMVSGSSI